MVDVRKSTVILPINGFAVPFHIQTLKSVIKQEEGDFTVLRFMFTTPGAITGKKEDTPFEDPSATFIRGVTYRSTDSFRFTEIHKEINDLKKAATKRDNERKELADVVEQDRLVEFKGASAWLWLEGRRADERRQASDRSSSRTSRLGPRSTASARRATSRSTRTASDTSRRSSRTRRSTSSLAT